MYEILMCFQNEICDAQTYLEMRSYEFSCSTTSVYFSTGILKVQNGNK